MKNTNNKTPAPQTPAQPAQLPQGFSTETLKTVAVIAVLVLAFTNWDAVVAIMVNVMIFIYGLVGQNCLPTLIQFPILFALIPSITYAIGSTPLSVLKLSRSLYAFQDAASLIPLNSKFLWMDLGLPERTLLLGFSIPVLALIVGLTTYVQTKLTMPPAANPNDQAAQTSKMMGIYMPVMLFFFSLNYASGLAVYFITSNILAIVQYAMMGKVDWRNLLPGGQKK